MISRSVLPAIVAFAVGCGGAGVHPWTPPSQRDAHDDPAQLRPGYGNTELHFWWPLAQADVAALQGADRARQGDAHALLALAILASADHRDAGSYARYQDRVDRFVADVHATIDGAPDDWHRGYELHRAMHRVFFGAERGELGNYELNQSRVTGIFETGRYNCISSAMLFTVLARAFSMPARGVEVPTHAFVEMGPPGGKIIEVETTSDTGFDWVHDERFYREGAARWSSSRGLRPVTLEDYQHRIVVEPYRLMARGMLNQIAYEQDDGDKSRLAEVAAFVAPDDVEAQRMRMTAYAQEARRLYDAKAERTMVRMFDTVAPAVTAIASRFSNDSQTMRLVAWAAWFYADALEVVGRGDEAVATADSLLDHVDDRWEDAAKLRADYINVLDDRMNELLAKKDYEGATKVVAKHIDTCMHDGVCGHNVEVVYGNWAADYERTGDWQGERKVLQDCVARLPNNAFCGNTLRDLESRHRF